MTGLTNGEGNQQIANADDSDGGNIAHHVAGSADRDRIGHSGDGDQRRIIPIPASIVKAICQIMVTVEAVKKSQRNHHGGYHFASTDDIYAAVTRKMGEVGLVLLSLEEKCEIRRVDGKDGRTAQWAHMEFSFVLATPTDTWTDPRARRTLYIQVTGPQTFQAAQSYAEKSYLRSLFKLPTGDMDLDSMPQAESEEDQVALASNRKRKSSSAAKRDGDDAVFNDLRRAIAEAETRTTLIKLRQDRWTVWSNMPPRWAEILEDEYNDRMEELES